MRYIGPEKKLKARIQVFYEQEVQKKEHLSGFNSQLALQII